jgi:hypothetical protein
VRAEQEGLLAAMARQQIAQALATAEVEQAAAAVQV